MSYIDPHAKLFHHLDKLHQIRTSGKTTAPINVEIDLSNRCSHGCAWCHFAYTHTRGPLKGKQAKPAGAVDGGDLMDVKLAIGILKQLRDMGVKSVTWTGGGEPTLHPYFNDIVFESYHYGLQQGIYTHGGHVDKERASILKGQFTWAFISLDECDRDSFRVSKGVDRFEQVLTGIRLLVSTPGPATIGVGFLLHQGNYFRVPEMVALGKSLGVNYVQFRPTILYEQDAPNRLAEDTEWINNALVYLRDYAYDASVIVDQGRFAMYQSWRGHGYQTCNWSALQTVITPNGKVWRCTNKREHADALLGDLTQEPFADLWARAGGSCAVDGACRVMCRGHIANITLDTLMVEPAHKNFI
jgi:cyclic pyranopterin phosphate synthase